MAVACLSLWLALQCDAHAGSIGFQPVKIPTRGGGQLAGGFWYPSIAQSGSDRAPISGKHLPLIVLSHGLFGRFDSLADLGTALAHAGFVAAAVSHDDFGPNWVLNPPSRSAQLRDLIDYALRAWPGRGHLDPSRIGAFGFSYGGFAVLVAVGGKPSPDRVAPHCRRAPAEWSCATETSHHLALIENPPPPSAWIADPRIKAAVVAAPALGYVFGREGLAAVKIPMQIWEAGNDHVLAEPWNAEAVRQDLPRTPEFHRVTGADHGDFSGNCPPGGQHACLSQSGFDRAAFQKVFFASIAKFFRAM
jgi:predicted dienelactone hydrolase